MGSNILIVEDEFLVAFDLEDMIRRAGHNVIGPAADRRAVDALTETPDIALVDVNLRDGPTGPAIARDLARRAQPAIIYVTASPQQIGEPASGALGYILKPFSEDTILSAINAVLAGDVRSAPLGLHLFNPT